MIIGWFALLILSYKIAELLLKKSGNFRESQTTNLHQRI
jgi:hypothetical protein